MNTAINKLVDELHTAKQRNSLELPSLPDVVVAIREAVQDEHKGVPHIARLLQMDPVMAARVMKIANSPLYNTGTTLTDVKLAITRLGLITTRNLITALAMHNLFTVKSFAMRERIRQLWQHSCYVAAIAQVLARTQRGLSADKALLAGLLHDIGILPILVFADRFPDLYQQQHLLDGAIMELRAELGQRILENWQMDKEIIDVPLLVEDTQHDHSGQADYADLIIVAHIHSQFGKPGQPKPLDFNRVPAFGKLAISKFGPDASVELLSQANSEIAATTRLLDAE